DGAQLDGPEEGGHEFRAVERRDEHPVLDLDAVLAEGVAHPAGAGRNLSVRLLDAIGGSNGDLVTPACFEVAVQQIGTRVVAKRQFSRRPYAHADSLGPRRLLKKCHRISNAYPPHEAGFAGTPHAARLHPGLLRSSRAYCTNTRAPVFPTPRN